MTRSCPEVSVDIIQWYDAYKWLNTMVPHQKISNGK